MIFFRRPRDVAAQIVFGLAVALAATTTHAATQVAQASQLLGRYVVDPRGSNLGELRDFIVDMKEGRAVFALIWAPGRQGGGGRFVTYPLPAKMVFDGNRIAIEDTRARIDELPGFGPGEEPDYAGPEFAPLIRPAAAGNEKSAWPGDDTGPRYVRATKLTDAEVKQANGARAGNIRDTMFDLETGQLNLVFEFDPAWHRVAGWIAMPPQSTKRQGAQLIAAFDPKDMKPAEPAAPAKGAAPAAPPPNPLDRDFRATTLIGDGVWDTKGAEIAKVADLIVDSSTAKVVSVIMVVGARQVAYPVPLIGATVTNGHLVLDIARDKLEAMSAPAADTSGKQRRASELTSTTGLFDSRNTKVGDLRDLVVNLNTAKVQYAVLEFDPNWVQAGMLVAMPLREVVPAKDKPGLAMRAELNELNRGMVIQKNAWPDFTSPQYKQIVGQYFK